MNFKDKLIKRLVDVGKKHRILVYPMLILVAIISAISHAIYWGRGNGKKLVASVAIVALLITQSLFLTSSADVAVDPEYDSGATTDEGTQIDNDTQIDDDTQEGAADESTDSGLAKNGDTSELVNNEGENNEDTLNSGNPAEDKNAENLGENIVNNAGTPGQGDAENSEPGDQTGSDDEGLAEDENLLGAGESEETDVDHLEYYIVYTDSEGQKVSGLLGSTYPDESGVASIEGPGTLAQNWGYYEEGSFNYRGPFLDSSCESGLASTVIDVVNADTYERDGNAIKLYYKAERTSYNVTIDGNGGVTGGGETSKTIQVVTTTGAVDEVVSYTPDSNGYGFKRTGYNYTGLGTSPVEVSLNNRSFYAQWEGQHYTVTYNVVDPRYEGKIDLGGEASIQKEYIYGDSVTPLTDSEINATSAGYVLVGWSDDGSNVSKYNKGVTLANNELAIADESAPSGISSTGKTLTAVWKYRDVDLSFSDGSKTITAQYGDTIDESIVTIYKDETEGNNNFSYTMSDESTNALGAIGISVQETKTGGNVTGFKLSGKLKDINEAGIPIVITISDSNKAEGDTSGTMTQTLTLISNKRQVTMDPTTVKDATGNPIEKNYNGLTSISTSGSCEVLDKVDNDDVKATFDAAAELDDPDVGTGKAVVLKNVKLAGDDASKYVLYNAGAVVPEGGTVTLDGVATVNPGVVKISIARVDGSDDAILFGQATPEYTLAIDNPQVLSETDRASYEGFSSDSERMNFITQKVGFSGWNCSRTIYSSPGEYKISPMFSSSGANYSADVTSAVATFTVGREEGEGHYTLLGTKNDNNIYNGLEIKASDGYNKIRIVNGGDITSDMTKSAAEALFSEVVTIPDMTDGTVVIQMLDSATGAITTTATLEHLNVDRNGPVLESFTVSPNKTYFNEFDFGTYYHAQDIDGSKVESVSITFEYSSEGSDCDKLYYKFLDENGSVRGGIHEVPMTKDGARYKGTITIGTGTYGELVVYATNLAGNSSAQNYIKLNEKLLGMDSYYEWIVENSITASDIVVLDKDGNPAASDVWYNSLTYRTSATDNDSGLQHIIWNITYPSGSSVTEKENAGYVLSNVASKTDYNKITGYTFSGTISSENIPAGSYSFGGTLYDNAGNSIALNEAGPYKLDCKKPVIEDNTNYTVSGYDDSIDFTFTVTEGPEESGVASVKLYLSDGTDRTELKSWGDAANYNYPITENGTYIIEATDHAGNVSTYEKTVTNLSSEIPVAPVITVDGTKGNGEWFIEKEPTVTITSEKTTSDGVPVDTYYNIIIGNKKLERTATTENFSFDLANDQQGEVTIEAWSISRSGVTSDKAVKTIYVDTDKPDLYITESTADEAGNLNINFKSTDTVSGVNTSKVLVNDKVADVTNNDGVVSGSFAASSATAFEISAEDVAGNKADTVKFVPMGLEVSPVMDIEDTSAYLSAQVVKGTYDIAECYIQYKKSTASTYDTALANKYDNERGKQIDYTFRNLTPDTEYDYKVYASTLTSKEVKTYEGSFRTSSKESTGVVYGTAGYDTNLAEGSKTYPIYVALYSGNTYIKSAKIESAEDNDYKFTDIADGTYRVVATNGVLSKETAVTLERGGVTYPATYASDGGINFVLSGLSTEVVLEDDTVALTVDGLEKIYNTGLYNGNVTPADMEVVRQGGTIKITLYASYMDVSSVSDTAETIFEDRLGNEAVIERYINIEVVKEVRNAEGELVNGTPTNITTLAEPVTLSFPLGSLAGQNIHVASLHGSGTDYSFKSWVNGSEAVLSANYITITTDRFSVYALYRYEVKDIYYTVKWLDGDGNVMKTETVKSGESATPPTATPTKKETDKYTYAFEGWDTDYSAITGDTIISAWFTANKKADKSDDKGGNSGGNSGGNNNSGNNGSNSGGNNGNNSGNSGNNGNNGNSTTPSNVTPGTNVTPSTTPSNNGGADDISTAPVRYTYMGSASSPKTGDATPVAVVMIFMLLSVAGMVVLRKKVKENK